MFFKATEELKKIRKFVDYRKMDLYDLPWIAQKIDDISYQLTMVINDMIVVDKELSKNDTIHTNEDLRKE